MSETLARPRLLYFADTMCSWCYGFAPEMQVILSTLGDRIDLLTFSGGLRPYTEEPMEEKMRGYLAATFQRIQEMTGQPFAEGPVQRPGFIYDTEPASRAVVTMRHLAPGEDYPFMLAIQRAFYAGGEDITQADVLAGHAEAAGVPRAAFLEAFASDEMRQATMADFQVAQKFGIDGFPTILVHRQDAQGKDELVLISKGYSKANIVIERLEAAISGAGAA